MPKQFPNPLSAALLLAVLFLFPAARAQQQTAPAPLPDAPDAALLAASAPAPLAAQPTLNLDPTAALFGGDSSSDATLRVGALEGFGQQTAAQEAAQTHRKGPCPNQTAMVDLDENCQPIPIDRAQPRRIFGILPNFRSVSAGAKPIPPGWKQNFKVATRQAFDPASFLFLGITSISAEGLDEHKTFGKGIGGFYTYTWHGFLDKTDGTYLGAWLLPSLLHEDTRYYAKGHNSGHGYVYRILYVASRQVVTRTYSGHDFPNIAGLGGKVLTQVISRTYYPASSATFGVLAEKFAYSAARDIGFTAIREFYPDLAGQYSSKRRTKNAAAKSAADVAAAAAGQSTTNPTGTKP